MGYVSILSYRLRFVNTFFVNFGRVFHSFGVNIFISIARICVLFLQFLLFASRPLQFCFLYLGSGGRSGGRTRTPLSESDFESDASASSAIRPSA